MCDGSRDLSIVHDTFRVLTFCRALPARRYVAGGTILRPVSRFLQGSPLLTPTVISHHLKSSIHVFVSTLLKPL